MFGRLAVSKFCAARFFLTLLFLVLCPLLSPLLAQTKNTANNTQKIKIVSAFCIDDEWSFNIFDGVTGKISPAKIGIRNGSGILVESFDESSQTALVRTTRGAFIVSLKEQDAPQTAALTAQTPSATPVNADEAKNFSERRKFASPDSDSSRAAPENSTADASDGSAMATPTETKNIPEDSSSTLAAQLAAGNGESTRDGAETAVSGENGVGTPTPPQENQTSQMPQGANASVDETASAASNAQTGSVETSNASESAASTRSVMTRSELLRLIRSGRNNDAK